MADKRIATHSSEDGSKFPFITLRLSSTATVLLSVGAILSLAFSGSWTWRLTSDFYTGHVTSNAGASRSDFAYLASNCTNASPISTSEFHERQQRLAQVLHQLDASAFIAEPGASAQYYANISQRQWGLSERPLLLMISPEVRGDTVEAKVSVLTPSFEATRAKSLVIPAADVSFAEWPEDADPYVVAMSALLIQGHTNGAIFVDGGIRNFIADGLQNAALEVAVVTAPVEIRSLRERKSSAELELLKCANEVTLLAFRAARNKMYIGMRESEAHQLVEAALSAAGLKDADALVLFGENAALPHGSGTDRVLGKSDFILIDGFGTLHGYHSDVTRTFALPESKIPQEHLDIWDYVQLAQDTASLVAEKGAITRTVDEAARDVITVFGYGPYFTHRLGHGIGLEIHESPYLRGGSSDVIQTGHTFSDEPGIYVEGKVGVRLEDCFYIDAAGQAVFLTAGVGGPAQDPWNP